MVLALDTERSRARPDRVLNAAWQIFALTLIVAVFAVVLWDAHIRSERTRTGRALGGALIASVLIGSWVLAAGSARGWAIALGGGALAELGRRAAARLRALGQGPIRSARFGGERAMRASRPFLDDASRDLDWIGEVILKDFR